MIRRSARSPAEVLDAYRERGLGSRLGFGRSPAVAVVDLILGFTRESSPLGSNLDHVICATRKLLDNARSTGVPVLFTTTAYAPTLRDAGLFVRKVPALEVLQQGSEEIELDPRLGRRGEETVIEKKYASAFFGTALGSELQTLGVDTLLIVGATTSGCIRATVVDALQHGYRPIVPEECVGDRSAEAHAANLLDIEAKYGDVVTLDEALQYLARRSDDEEA